MLNTKQEENRLKQNLERLVNFNRDINTAYVENYTLYINDQPFLMIDEGVTLVLTGKVFAMETGSFKILAEIVSGVSRIVSIYDHERGVDFSFPITVTAVNGKIKQNNSNLESEGM